MNLRLNKKTKIIAFLVPAGAILLSLPFLFPGFGILILIALVPILFLERFISENKTKGGWLYVYLTFILWNSFTTYWIAYANFKGAVGAILLYSLGVTLVVRVYSWFRKRTNIAIGYSFLILGWIAFEHLLAEGEIAWPWLALGNGFATSYKVVQWYEFTGVFGGTLWALVVSIFVFDLVSKIINSSISEKTIKIRYSILALVIILPAFTSHLIYSGYK